MNTVREASQAWKDLAAEQANLWNKIERERATIKPLIGAIDDNISWPVQSQYEKYPYPVWDAAEPRYISEGEKMPLALPRENPECRMRHGERGH